MSQPSPGTDLPPRRAPVGLVSGERQEGAQGRRVLPRRRAILRWRRREFGRVAPPTLAAVENPDDNGEEAPGRCLPRLWRRRGRRPCFREMHPESLEPVSMQPQAPVPADANDSVSWQDRPGAVFFLFFDPFSHFKRRAHPSGAVFVTAVSQPDSFPHARVSMRGASQNDRVSSSLRTFLSRRLPRSFSFY